MYALVNPPSAVIFSGNIKDVIVQAVLSNINVKILKNGAVIVDETYSPDPENKVTLKLRDLIDDQLKVDVLLPSAPLYVQGSASASFELRINNETHAQFVAVKGGVDTTSFDYDLFFKSNWLTWQPQTKYVGYHDPEHLSYFALTATDVVARGYFADQTQQTVTVASLAAERLTAIDVNYGRLVGMFSSQPLYIDLWTEVGGQRLSYVQRLVLTKAPRYDGDTYIFQNTLGGVDTAVLSGSTTLVNEMGVQTAVFDETQVDYKIDDNQSVVKNTGFIKTEAERIFLMDFMVSDQKATIFRSRLRPIVLKEHNLSQTLHELSSFDFTYQFAVRSKYKNVQRSPEPPALLEIGDPDGEVFFLPPRLNEFPEALDYNNLLIPVQYAFAPSWQKMSVQQLKENITSEILTLIDTEGVPTSEVALLAIRALNADKADLATDSMHAEQADRAALADIATTALHADLADYAQDSDKWDGQQFASYLNQPVRSTDVVQFAGLTTPDIAVTAKMLIPQVSNPATNALWKSGSYLMMGTAKAWAGRADLWNGLAQPDYVTQAVRPTDSPKFEGIGSQSFVSGFTGNGYRLAKDGNGDYLLEVDRMLVRKDFSVYELIVNQIRATNGSLWVSDAIKITGATASGANFVCTIDTDGGTIYTPFAVNDILRCQIFNGKNLKYYTARVVSVTTDTFTITKIEGASNPATGDELVRIGNTTNVNRQGALYLTASDSGAPYLDVVDGVNSASLANKTKVRLGKLDGIVDTDLGALSGYGLYGNNVFLKGKLIVQSGSNVYTKTEANTQVATAKSEAITTASTDATTKANSAQANAISTAASDATTKANNAQANAIAAAAIDALNKANAARDAAINTANQFAQDAVNTIEVGGRNLLLNSHYYNGTANIGSWAVSGYTTVVLDGHVLIHSVTASQSASRIERILTLDKGIYTLTINAKISTYFDFANFVNANVLSVSSQGSDYFANHICTFEVIEDGEVRIRPYFRNILPVGATFEIDWFKLEKGNKATDWSPAPEDLTNAVEVLRTETQTQFNVLEGEINSKVSQVDFNALNQRVGTAETNITQNANQISLRATKTEVNTQVATAKSEAISTASTDATTKANSAQANAISTASADATTKANNAKTQATNDAKAYTDGKVTAINADITTITTRVTNAETAIDQNADAIALRATKTEVTQLTTVVNGKANQSSVTALETRMSSAEVKIEPDAIRLTVKAQTESIAQTAIDGLQVGGRNLLLNSNSPTLFNPYQGATVIRTPGQIVPEWGANDACRVVSSGGNSPIRLLQQFGIPQPGDIVTISVWIKNNGASVIQVRSNLGGRSKSISPSESVRVVFEGIAGNGTGGLHFQIRPTLIEEDVDITWWRIKYEKGNKATDWSPAPEDLTNAVEVLRTETQTQFNVLDGQIASKVSQTDFNALNQRVGTAETNITQNANQINLRATKTEVNTQVATAKSEAISTASTDATNKANSAQANAISTASADATTKANNAKTQATNEAKTYTDSQITIVNNAISLKASQTDVNNLGTRMATAEAKIEPDAIRLTVKAQTEQISKQYSAEMLAQGKMLRRDPYFKDGKNGMTDYPAVVNCTVDRITDSASPTGISYRYVSTGFETGTRLTFAGLGTSTRANAVFIVKMIAKIPVGWMIYDAHNASGTGRKTEWLTPREGTGSWETYVFKLTCGEGGTFSTINYFDLRKSVSATPNPTPAEPVTSYLCYATVFDMTGVDDTPTRDEIKAGIQINANAIEVFGQSISMAGKVTFASLDAGAQGQITGAQSAAATADGKAVAAQNAANAANTAALDAAGIANGKGKVIYASSAPTGDDRQTTNLWIRTTDNKPHTWSGSAWVAVESKVATDAATAANTANTNLATLQGNLKAMAYENMVSLAKLDTTIINGGYIKANLIDIQTLLAQTIVATGQITASNLVVTGASKVGGFSISGNKLVNDATDTAIMFDNLSGANTYLRINKMYTDPILSIGTAEPNRTGLRIQTFASGVTGLYILNNLGGGNGKAIASYGSHELVQRAGESWNAPGVLGVVLIDILSTSHSVLNQWTSAAVSATFSHMGSRTSRWTHNLGHTDYLCTATIRNNNNTIIQNVHHAANYCEVTIGPQDGQVYIMIFGRNKVT